MQAFWGGKGNFPVHVAPGCTGRRPLKWDTFFSTSPKYIQTDKSSISLDNTILAVGLAVDIWPIRSSPKFFFVFEYLTSFHFKYINIEQILHNPFLYR